MKEFEASKECENIIKFIKEYYHQHNLEGVVIGISGGKDSAVVAALFTKALGHDNVLGVTLPCHSSKEDKEDAKLISDYYGFKLINFDITNTFDTFKQELYNLGNFDDENLKNSDINLKPKLRMATLYYIAALYTSLKKRTYLVAGTSNKCECYVGYFTKGGDSVHDISVLSDLTVSEVIEIGKYLKVPEKVLYKVPSDGLSNQSDEEKLGVKYKDIELFIKDESLVEEKTAYKIKKLHKENYHKFLIPTYNKERK